MDTLIIHPSIPYYGKIGGGGKFNPRKLIIIKAVIPKLTNGFNIKLKCDPKQDGSQEDIALQIYVQHLNQCIFLNSFVQGKWGIEDFKSIGTDENFEIALSCEFDKYKININGKYFYEYPQTIHYDKISHLNINGDVSIVQISYESISVDSYQGVEPISSFNNGDTNSSPPSSHEITINDSEKLIRYPNEPIVADYVAAYGAQPIQLNTTDAVSTSLEPIEPERSCCCLKRCSALGVIFVVGVILKTVSKQIVGKNNEHYYHP